MSWLYLPAAAVDCSVENCSDGERCVTSSMTDTVSTCSRPGSEMDTLTTGPSGMMCGPSTGVPGLDAWISSLRASHASRTAQQGTGLEIETSGTSGLIPFALFERSGPNGSYWKMSQGCFPTLMFDEYSETWPRAGMMRAGIAYQRLPLAPLTSEIGFGLWATPTRSDSTGTTGGGNHRSLRTDVKFWPTPTVADTKTYWHNRKRKNPNPSLAGAVDMFPTPCATNWKNRETSTHSRDLQKKIGGQLNPNWVEWLMGWPIGWTGLEPLETVKFQQWLELHGNYCPEGGWL